MNRTHYFYGSLRNISKEDLKNLISLDNTEMKYPWTKDSWEQSHRADNLMCIMEHSSNKEVVACVLFSFKANESVEIHKFIVDKSWRRAGKGRLLFNKLKSEIKIHAKLLKYDFILEVSVENEAAIGFYKAIGFKVLAIRKRFYSDGKDALTMTLTI